MLSGAVQRLRRLCATTIKAVRATVFEGLRPRPNVAFGFIGDAFRSRDALLAENALLRQQLVVAQRHVNKPVLRRHERAVMVGLSAIVDSWRDVVLLVKPDTVIRWHRKGFELFWRVKSKAMTRKPRIAAETIATIHQMAEDNALWGAERIRGELLKLDIRVSKRTIQKHMRQVRGPRPWGQSWATFLRNHACETWACDFVQTYDIWFRPIFAFFIIEIGSREVVHVGVTRNPTATWTAQQLRNATPFGQGPRFIIRDNDDKFTAEFDRAARGAEIRVLRTAVKAPLMNSFCERFIGSARRECLDHVIIHSERQMQRVLEEYCFHYFNTARPHQGRDQSIPKGSNADTGTGDVLAVPVLNGLHHDYRRAV